MKTDNAMTWTEKDADYIRQFDSVIRVIPYKLTRQTRSEIDAKLNDLAQYENAHTDFDIHDLNGEVASVYLFQKGGKLYARGANHTSVFRNPNDLYKFLPRSRRVHNITFITKHEASNPTRQDSTTVKTFNEKAEHENDLRHESRQDYESDQLAGNPPEYNE